MRVSFPHTQIGMGKWGWLLFVIAAVFIGSTALRLGPHYLDFQVIQSVVERLPASQVHGEMTRGEIREHFQKQFRVENFSFKVKDIVKIERTKDETIVDVNYEVREPLFYNIDVVLSFSEQRSFQ